MKEDIRLKNDLLFKQAIALVKANEFGEAMKYCEDMIRNDATDIDGWDIKAMCHFAKNEFSKAVLCYDKVLEMHPDDKMDAMCKNNCLLIMEDKQTIQTLKKLENLHKAGILELDDYLAMRKLALDDFHRRKRL